MMCSYFYSYSFYQNSGKMLENLQKVVEKAGLLL